jgi:alkylation response protein AidB-like acyl-CoA dehydrogenase
MDFNLTSEQTFIRETIRKFMARECPREKAHELDEQGSFPGELLAKIAEMGFCSLTVPEAYGGAGQDLLGAAIVVEEIATTSPALAGLFASVTFGGGQVIACLGSSAQKERYLPEIAEGGLVFSLALCSTLNIGGVTAVTRGNTFILNGRISDVSLANRADYLIVQASANDSSTLFLISAADAPGIFAQETEMVGSRGAGLAEVSFENVPVAAEDVLGEPTYVTRGKEQATYATAVDHLATAALSLGLAQGAYAYTADYAGERVQFGQPIVQFEAIQHMLVDLAVSLQSTRWLLYHACWLADQGKPFAPEAAMARLQAGELARQAGLQSVHILGGYGYMAEYDAQRYLRDSLVLFNGGETAELLKNNIGELIGLGKKL